MDGTVVHFEYMVYVVEWIDCKNTKLSLTEAKRQQSNNCLGWVT